MQTVTIDLTSLG